MAKLKIATLEEAAPVDRPIGVSGDVVTQAFFDQDEDPIHLHLHTLERGAVARVGPNDADCLAYVWKGAAMAGGRWLSAGSSAIVEHGAAVDIEGEAETTVVLIFNGTGATARPRAGGKVHLLPAELVPHSASSAAHGITGGLHADSGCPTCQIWLHENSFEPVEETAAAGAEAGVHSHTEDEVIFVTGGHLRFGTKLYGAGTALAIAAHTFYSVAAGPEGLQFVNFRPAQPGEIKIKGGPTLDEVALWRDRSHALKYLEPLPA